MALIQTALISPAHDDLVTDAAFDYYGTRLATCSLDQKIKIWLSTSDGSGKWILEDEWEAHDAPICSIGWAHPEFGQMLVSGSMDRTTKVWEKLPSFLIEEATESGPRTKAWKMVCSLGDARGAVRSVEFAPAMWGLKLASLSTDSILRIYEFIDAQEFALVDSVDVQTLAATPASDLEAALMLFSAPALTGVIKDEVPAVIEGSWSLSWCKDPHWGELLAITFGSSSDVKIIRVCSTIQQTSSLLVISPPTTTATSKSSSNSVTTLAWSNTCNRAHQTIATGSKDGHVRIWKVLPPLPLVAMQNGGMDVEVDNEDLGWEASLAADFGDHDSPITKVSWNATGTVLTSSGDDGCLRMYQNQYSGWKRVGLASAQQAPIGRRGDAMEL